jgi:hypothetical protein
VVVETMRGGKGGGDYYHQDETIGSGRLEAGCLEDREFCAE